MMQTMKTENLTSIVNFVRSVQFCSIFKAVLLVKKEVKDMLNS